MRIRIASGVSGTRTRGHRPCIARAYADGVFFRRTNIMRRAHRKTAARDSAQIALLAPWVAGARVMSAMMDLQRGRIDPVETARMWTEKSAALAESWTKANAALLRFALTTP